MTGRVVRFVQAAQDATSRSGVETVVLDTTWTPAAGDPRDVRSARPLLLEGLRRMDPLQESMRLLDDWAAVAEAVDRLEVDGVSLWYRRRLHLWRALHDRLIWRGLLVALEEDGPLSRIELAVTFPELADVARAAAATGRWEFDEPAEPAAQPAPPARRRLPWPIDPILWRLGRRPNQRDRGANAAVSDPTDWAAVASRVRDLSATPGRVLVLTSPATYQAVARGGGGATAVQDPFLGPVVDELGGRGVEPIVLELGARGRLAKRPGTAPAGDRAEVLPADVLGRLFSDTGDSAWIEATRAGVAARVAEPMPPLVVEGVDLGPWVAGALRDYAGPGLASELRESRRIGRLLASLRPSAVLMINEYSRPEWPTEAHRRGIPVVAVQHGVIHPRHAGYVLPSRDRLALVDRTCVFGPYEARLLTGSSVYRSDEVVVGGAPRLDLVVAGAPAADERARIRGQVGAAPDDRLLVFSSTSSTPVRSSLVAAAFETLLDGPWPGIHLVVRLHPAEDDGQAFYPPLIAGIAAARGFAPPQVSLVRSVDLYELLRGADAHLGITSTVLTDAIVAGTPNLILTGLAGTDLLGYVEAGVARPVRSAADLVAALADPEAIRPTAADRDAFLADHFAPGPSAPTIARALLELSGRRAATLR